MDSHTSDPPHTDPGSPTAGPTDRAVQGVDHAQLFAPGGPGAVAGGCTCSILANAGYRTGADPYPVVDPDCPSHTI